METLGGLLILFLFLGGWRLVLRLLAAGVDTLADRGTAEQWKARAFGMGAFEIRTRRIEPETGRQFTVIEVQARGLIPVVRTTNLGFITTVVDKTNPQEVLPIISTIDEFQEPGSVAYQYSMRPSRVGADEGFVDWSRVGVLIPDILTPPRKGTRQLEVWIHLIDTANPPVFSHGFVESGRPVASYRSVVEWRFDRHGYEDAAEARRERRPLMIRLAVSVAAADGEFAEAEGKTIQHWIQRQLSLVSESQRNLVKQECNDALRIAYERAGKVSISEICDELLQVSDTASLYEAIELCLDVMAADGQVHPAELDLIHKISEALGLDYGELQRMKDQRLMNVDVQTMDEQSAETLLGIDPKWSAAKVRDHLREEFKRWNGRLNTLSDQTERQNVQARLNLISETRRKYAA